MILETPAYPELRVMAINLLGKFLSNKDNNIKYVALTTLVRTVELDTQSIQRHRQTVFECVYDPDPAIKNRALNLAFELV